jgi:hypothetical protein
MIFLVIAAFLLSVTSYKAGYDKGWDQGYDYAKSIWMKYAKDSIAIWEDVAKRTRDRFADWTRNHG